MRHIILILCLAISVTAAATEQFVTFKQQDGAVLLSAKNSGTFSIAYDEAHEHKGVAIALQNLAADFEKVCGVKPATVNSTKLTANSVKPATANSADGIVRIVVGSFDKSELIKKLVKEKKIDGRMLDGKWEKYVITTVALNAKKPEAKTLVIAGSDKRGTIYGIYELSRQIGVNPWYWWADVPVARRDEVYVLPGLYTDGEPAVKYRGIFINDEWPSFGTWANNLFGGINSKMYSKMFELLLRLKANYLWPAMWDSAFNEDDPRTQALADEYGIVMGTSHHEPMMRAHKEYVRRKGEIGAWDYIGNHDKIEQFFTEGVERAKNYENIITIGMRGDGDVALGSSDEECISSLKTIVAGQRNIIEKVYGKPAYEVPQLWAIFTEVQRYYDAGLTVPDDVTLLFCDNNWGYIRRTGPEKERGRKGGLGMYYHIDMNGGPWNDRWVNTTTAAKIREQLNLAYRTGIDRIWIINVGDLKPKEMPIDFIMNFAWNPDAYPADRVDEYMVGWARSCFGGEHAREIAGIVEEYSRLNLERKPEVQRVGIYNKEEAHTMMARWNSLEERALALGKKIAPEYQDAFYQLVEYPAVASAGVAKIYLAATLAAYEPEKEEAYRETMQQLFERDKALTDKYNKGIAGGKWNGMMLDKHIGYTQWSMPNDNSLEPLFAQMKQRAGNTKAVNTEYTESTEIAIMAYDYSRRTATADAAWTFLPGLGRGKGCMGIEPVTAKSRPEGDGAELEYDFTLSPAVAAKSNGSGLKLALGILPTNDINPARGLRIGVRIDNGAMQTIDARQGYVDTFNEYTKENIARSQVLKPLPRPASDIYLSGFRQHMRSEVFDNLRWLSINLGNLAPDQHTLKIVMIDPELVIEKLVINPDNEHPSYYGKPAEQ